MDSASSDPLIYEVCRSITQIPLVSLPLLQLTITRLQAFIHSDDPTVKAVFVAIYMRLLKLSPKLAIQHRDVIAECLDAEDDSLQIIALELLCSMTNAKNVDKIVAKMFSHYQTASTITFRNQIITTIIELCSRDDYKLVTDFGWYISVLLDFINESGFTCYRVVADQLLDLAARVPATRPRLAQEIPVVFEKNYEYKDTWPLLLAAAHIIGEYSPSSLAFEKIITRPLFECNERVQQAFLTATLEFFLRFQPKPRHLVDKMAMFATSAYPSVQLDANAYSALAAQLLQDPETCEAITQHIQTQIVAEDEDDTPIEPPEGIDAPNELFANIGEDEVLGGSAVSAKPKAKPATKRKKKQRAAEPDGQSPEQPTYLQELGHNGGFTVSLDSVDPEGIRLSLDLVFANHSPTVITTMDIQMIDSGVCRAVEVTASAEEIRPDAKGCHTITIECEKPFLPEIVKFIFTPISSGGDCLEARLRIFPSYFLAPIKPDTLPLEKCVHQKDVQVKLKAAPPVCLKQLVKLLKAKVVADKATKTVKFYSKTSYGEFAFVEFLCEGKVAHVTVRSTLAELSDSLGHEIDMNLKTL
jgi:AP-3 complex subunit delta-1